MIERLNTQEQAKLRRAGRCAAAVLDEVLDAVTVGMSTSQLDACARDAILRRGARSSQLGHHGFSGHVCTSRNDVVCHGIPNPRERIEAGDIINVDVTVELDGFHGDTSRTIAVGEVSAQARGLIRETYNALEKGIAAVRSGARIGDIGAAIQSHALTHGLSVVRDYCGHGIGREMHMEPQIPHVGSRGRGLRLLEGMAFTIEPMLNLGGSECTVDPDGWTVRTRDKSWSAQFEHTVLVTGTGVEVMTLSG